MRQRFRKLTLLAILATTPLALAADRQRVQELAMRFMCVCSCHQILGVCNMMSCPSSGPMKAELGKLLDEGRNEESIVAHFVEKYGESVLSAPPARGFNLTAWIMPFAALGIGLAALAVFVRRFRARWSTVPSADVDLSKYQRKVEEELEKYTPED